MSFVSDELHCWLVDSSSVNELITYQIQGLLSLAIINVRYFVVKEKVAASKKGIQQPKKKKASNPIRLGPIYSPSSKIIPILSNI